MSQDRESGPVGSHVSINKLIWRYGQYRFEPCLFPLRGALMCQSATRCNKIKYDTKTEALIVKANCEMKLNFYNSWKRRECREYYCEECQAWHLTSQKKQETKMENK